MGGRIIRINIIGILIVMIFLLCIPVMAQGLLQDKFPRLSDLKNNSPEVRLHAVEALERLNGSDVVDSLIIALDDKNSSVRSRAALALGKRNATHAIGPLISALKDNSSEVRGSIAQALTRIGFPAVVSLIRALRSDNINVRANAARVLGRIGDRRAINQLNEALDDNSTEVQSSAAYALRKIEWKSEGTS